MKKNRTPEQSEAEQPMNGQVDPLTGNPETTCPDDAEKTVTGAADNAGQEEGNATDPVRQYLDQLEAKERDFNELSDKYLRLAAEYDNFRRRTQKEKEALYNDSITTVVKEWLPVLDNLDRAAVAAALIESDEVKKIIEGISMVQKQAQEAMDRLGVSEIDCEGKPFDPAMHNAVMHVEDESVGASTVLEVLQKGYCRDDRVIRHSLVKVAN